MAKLKLYDYTSQTEDYLNVGLVNVSDLSDLTSGTIAGWSVSFSTSSSEVSLSASYPEALDPDDLYTRLYEDLGIRNSGLYNANIDDLTAGITYTWGLVDDYSSRPYITLLKYTYSDGCIYRVGAYPTGTGGVTAEASNYAENTGFASPVFFYASDDFDSGYLGVMTFISNSQSNITSVFMRYYTSSAAVNRYSPSSGDKGFRPRGEQTKHTLGGGSSSGDGVDYDTDVLTQPGAPDESSASIVGGAGFINIYKVSETNLAKLGHCLFSDTIMTAFQALLVNPLDSVISLNIFPCSPDVGGSEPINLFRWACAASGAFALGTLAQGQRLAKQFKVFDFGTLSVAEMWESFLDYDATSFELYLPFIGAVDIPVGEVMNGSVNVAYTVDFVSGMCVANVLCTKTAKLSNNKVTTQYAQHSYTGNCAMNVPLSAINYGNMIGSFVSAAASGLRAPMSIVTSALEGKMQPAIETKGTVGGNAGFCSVLYPYITVTRPITAEPESYQEVMGYPSYINTSLAYCSDLCVCDEINLTGISGATDNEIERIRQICKGGIYV